MFNIYMRLNKVLSIATVLGAFLVSVTSVSAATMQLFSKATTQWSSAQGASSYNVYYKESGAKIYNHAVRNLPKTSVSYTVSYLKRGVSYKYKVSAINSGGNEFWWSKEALMTKYQNQ